MPVILVDFGVAGEVNIGLFFGQSVVSSSGVVGFQSWLGPALMSTCLVNPTAPDAWHLILIYHRTSTLVAPFYPNLPNVFIFLWLTTQPFLSADFSLVALKLVTRDHVYVNFHLFSEGVAYILPAHEWICEQSGREQQGCLNTYMETIIKWHV